MDKNKFAITPPMGWNSYDYYDTTVTENDIRKNAKYMADNLKSYGWEYIVIDIQWYSHDAGTNRKQYQYIPFGDYDIDEYGRLIPCERRFPSSKGGKGFKELSDYVHSLGLKFGIHIMRGIPRRAADNHCKIYGTDFGGHEAANAFSICRWNPDMYGVKNNEAGQAYYDSIISMYADWGVDFIKCDDICDSQLYNTERNPFSGWYETEMLHKAIEKSGRDIVLSLSPGPAHIDKAFLYCENANMWRITDDFWDDWDLLKNMFYRCELWQDHVKTGCYPDCDMIPLGKLEKGFGKERDCYFNENEKKTMMTLWCMFRSPLMLGCELTKLDDDTLKYITNKKLLSLLTDGRKGVQLRRTNDEAVWINYDNNKDNTVIALFNLSDSEKEISVSEIKASIKEELKELWTGETGYYNNNEIHAVVPAHGVKVFG